MGETIIHLGSNIDPADNIRLGARKLAERLPVIGASSVWLTPSVGSAGPSFYNAAVHCTTDLSAYDLKINILRLIEQEMGRVRTHDKYAARTIDMDGIILNSEVLEPHLWDTGFILLPVAELLPELTHPINHLSLRSLAKVMEPSSGAMRLKDFLLFPDKEI
jgi:2-amino-4-hydroxy-6-hydroxymethyldihydropteridine diphosphokinase